MDMYPALEIHCQVLWQCSLPCTLANTGEGCVVLKTLCLKVLSAVHWPRERAVFSAASLCRPPASAINHSLGDFDCVLSSGEAEKCVQRSIGRMRDPGWLVSKKGRDSMRWDLKRHNPLSSEIEFLKGSSRLDAVCGRYSNIPNTLHPNDHLHCLQACVHTHARTHMDTHTHIPLARLLRLWNHCSLQMQFT